MPQRAERGRRLIAVVPNALSVLRLAIAIIFPLLLPAWRLPAVIVGGATDLLDGFIARRYDVRSVSGGLLDAIADKAMVLSVLITLSVDGRILWWQVLLVLLRDLAVLVTAGYAALQRAWRRFTEMSPRVAGKITTLLVFAWFVTLLIEGAEQLAAVLFILAAAASAVASADYLTTFVRAVRAQTAERG